MKLLYCAFNPPRYSVKMKKLFTLFLIVVGTHAFAQKLDTLTIEKIMRDPKWIGVSPSDIKWSDDGKKIYFKWNPENTFRDEWLCYHYQ